MLEPSYMLAAAYSEAEIKRDLKSVLLIVVAGFTKSADGTSRGSVSSATDVRTLFSEVYRAQNGVENEVREATLFAVTNPATPPSDKAAAAAAARASWDGFYRVAPVSPLLTLHQFTDAYYERQLALQKSEITMTTWTTGMLADPTHPFGALLLSCANAFKQRFAIPHVADTEKFVERAREAVSTTVRLMHASMTQTFPVLDGIMPLEMVQNALMAQIYDVLLAVYVRGEADHQAKLNAGIEFYSGQGPRDFGVLDDICEGVAEFPLIKTVFELPKYRTVENKIDTIVSYTKYLTANVKEFARKEIPRGGSSKEGPEAPYNVVVLGGPKCGKTALIRRFVTGQFTTDYTPTPTTSVSEKTMKVEGYDCKLRLFDTPGADKFAALDLAIQAAHGFVLVYAVNSVTSFNQLVDLREKIIDIKGTVNVPMVLVGTKNDVEAERQITKDQGKLRANTWKCAFADLSCIPGPSKTPDAVFKRVVSKALEQRAPPAAPSKPKDLTLSGDDLIALVTYAIFRAGLPTVCAEVKFMEDFMDEDTLNGESGYLLTVLISGVTYLQNYEENREKARLQAEEAAREGGDKKPDGVKSESDSLSIDTGTDESTALAPDADLNSSRAATDLNGSRADLNASRPDNTARATSPPPAPARATSPPRVPGTAGAPDYYPGPRRTGMTEAGSFRASVGGGLVGYGRRAPRRGDRGEAGLLTAPGGRSRWRAIAELEPPSQAPAAPGAPAGTSDEDGSEDGDGVRLEPDAAAAPGAAAGGAGGSRAGLIVGLDRTWSTRAKTEQAAPAPAGTPAPAPRPPPRFASLPGTRPPGSPNATQPAASAASEAREKKMRSTLAGLM